MGYILGEKWADVPRQPNLVLLGSSLPRSTMEVPILNNSWIPGAYFIFWRNTICFCTWAESQFSATTVTNNNRPLSACAVCELPKVAFTTCLNIFFIAFVRIFCKARLCHTNSKAGGSLSATCHCGSVAAIADHIIVGWLPWCFRCYLSVGLEYSLKCRIRRREKYSLHASKYGNCYWQKITLSIMGKKGRNAKKGTSLADLLLVSSFLFHLLLFQNRVVQNAFVLAFIVTCSIEM